MMKVASKGHLGIDVKLDQNNGNLIVHLMQH